MYKAISFLLFMGLIACLQMPAEGVDVNDFKSIAPPRYEVSEPHQMLWKDQINDILRTAQVAEGPQVILYDTGVASLDSWYPTPGIANTTPPDDERYHEFTYVNGSLVTVQVMDNGKRELVYRLWHDRQGGPVLCILYVDGKESGYALASYNAAGLINEVVRFNQNFVPVWISIHEHTGVYETCMITTYGQSKGYKINHREFFDGEGVWVEADNHPWRRVNNGSLRASLESLQKHGIKPHYPIPPAQEGTAADSAVPRPRD